MQETHKGIMDEPPTLEVVSNNRALFLTVVNKRPVSR